MAHPSCARAVRTSWFGRQVRRRTRGAFRGMRPERSSAGVKSHGRPLKRIRPACVQAALRRATQWMATDERKSRRGSFGERGFDDLPLGAAGVSVINTAAFRRTFSSSSSRTSARFCRTGAQPESRCPASARTMRSSAAATSTACSRASPSRVTSLLSIRNHERSRPELPQAASAIDPPMSPEPDDALIFAKERQSRPGPAVTRPGWITGMSITSRDERRARGRCCGQSPAR